MGLQTRWKEGGCSEETIPTKIINNYRFDFNGRLCYSCWMHSIFDLLACKLFLYILLCLKSFKSTVVRGNVLTFYGPFGILWMQDDVLLNGLVNWTNCFIIYGFGAELLRLWLLMFVWNFMFISNMLGWVDVGVFD